MAVTAYLLLPLSSQPFHVSAFYPNTALALLPLFSFLSSPLLVSIIPHPRPVRASRGDSPSQIRMSRRMASLRLYPSRVAWDLNRIPPNPSVPLINHTTIADTADTEDQGWTSDSDLDDNDGELWDRADHFPLRYQCCICGCLFTEGDRLVGRMVPWP
jgi:hypothetical protein